MAHAFGPLSNCGPLRKPDFPQVTTKECSSPSHVYPHGDSTWHSLPLSSVMVAPTICAKNFLRSLPVRTRLASSCSLILSFAIPIVPSSLIRLISAGVTLRPDAREGVSAAVRLYLSI